jgi:putative aldouronate transport system substrate-binding protein
MKRSFVLGLSALIALIPGFVTGAASPKAQAAGPVEVQMFAQVDPSFQATNISTNWFTKYVEQKFNMKIDWITAPPADAVSKQQLLLQSGNYPPIFYNGNFTPDQLAKYGQEGIIIPLNKLLARYAPNVLKAYKELPGSGDAVTDPHGTIWSIPSINYCLHCDFASKLWINTTWLAKLHLSMPKTPAELLSVLTAFKSVPGVKNPIPLSGSTDGWHGDPSDFLMNAFIYDDGTTGGVSGQGASLHLLYQNGKLEYAPVQTAWQQGLEYIHSLVTAGVLDSSAFSQPNTALRAEAAQGRVGAFAWGVDNGVINYTVPGNKSSDWVVVPPLTGPSGANWAGFFGQGPTAGAFVITNKATADQIKAVLEMVNFIFTAAGTNYMNFGPQSPKTWYMPAKPGTPGLCMKQALWWINWNASTSLVGWNQLGPMYQSETWRCGYQGEPIFSPISEESKYQIFTQEYYEGHQPRYVYPAAVWVPQSQLTSFATLQTNIQSYTAQWTYDFILGRKDITKDWNTYLSGLNNLGLANYLNILSSNAKPLLTAAYCPASPASLPCHH